MEIVVWALLTGLVTGGAWMGIMVGEKLYRLARREPHLLGELDRQEEELRHLEARLEATEVQLDETERRLFDAERETRLEPPKIRSLP